MDYKHKDTLLSKLNELKWVVDYQRVSSLLVERNIVSKDHVSRITRNFHNDNDRNCELILLLTKRGPTAFAAFVECLESSECTAAYALVTNCPGVLPEQSVLANGTSSTPSGSSDLHDKLTKWSLASMLTGAADDVIKTIATQSEYGSGDTCVVNQSLVGSSSLISACPAQGEDAPDSRSSPAQATDPAIILKKLTVKNTTFLKMPDARTYKMLSNPKGHALVINNSLFSDPTTGQECADRRYGSEVDEKNISDVFTALGFEVHLYRNKTEAEMRTIIVKFANEPLLETVDSCVVIIMSHGRSDAVQTSDNNWLKVTWIIDQFNNDNCIFLRHKPKVFFLQNCRGERQDPGVCIMNEYSNGNGAMSAFDSNPQVGIIQDPTRLVTYSDILIAYATNDGFGAVRNVYHGSWFIKIVCEVFAELAHELDLTELLNEVQVRLALCQTEDGCKQSGDRRVIGTFHKFYFNPGMFG